MTANDGAALPTRTFLFTDLEGSTRTWERDLSSARRGVGGCGKSLEQAIARELGTGLATG